jgi:hypothetical protein
MSSSPDDPPRLVDPGSPASARVRRLLEECRADVGTDEEIQKLAASLALWKPGAETSPLKAAGGKAVATTALKVAIGAAVAAAAGGLWLYDSRLPSSRQAAPSSTTRESPPPVVETETPRAPVSATRPAADENEPAANDVTKNSAPFAEPKAASSAHRAASDSPSEADLLGQAQAALSGNPERALSLSEQHRRRFPHGLLVQEREVIAIEALARLGRTAEAKTRGERFLRAFPTSAHRSKIESTVGGK